MKVLAIILIVIVVLAILYFLMIMPRMIHKPDTAPFKEWLYAHRGLHDNATEAPENSMAAFRKAADAGFGIELDIQLTKDKIPVVFHDFTLKRVCGGEGKISDYTYEELQQFHLCDSVEKIPKFEDVLKMVDGKVPLIVEFKIERTDLSLCPLADKMLRAYKGMYCMESFNPLGVVVSEETSGSGARPVVRCFSERRRVCRDIIFCIAESAAELRDQAGFCGIQSSLS